MSKKTSPQRTHDDLDRYVQQRATEDPEFAELWKESVLRKEIQTHRSNAGLTQTDVAKRLGVPQSRIAEIEKRPLHVRAERLFQYLEAIGARLTITSDGESGQQAS